jgi:hypothetical protein
MPPTFQFTVDGESYSTTEHILTPIQIMQLAGIDPVTHYLVQLIGQNQESFQDEPNKEIHMHQHMRFIAIPTGPATVS